MHRLVLVSCLLAQLPEGETRSPCHVEELGRFERQSDCIAAGRKAAAERAESSDPKKERRVITCTQKSPEEFDAEVAWRYDRAPRTLGCGRFRGCTPYPLPELMD